MGEPEQQVAELTHLLGTARRAVALTGAGVSTESGIPDFRSDGGLWDQVNPEQVASIAGFLQDPAGFYRFWADKFAALVDAEPSPAHRLLSELEAQGTLRAVITQNIDGLHQRAGSRRVYEVHGSFQRAHCMGCQAPYGIDFVFTKVTGEGEPRCEYCGDLLKPGVVLFGEMLPPAFGEAASEVDQSDLLLVLGSSLEVFPVADLVPRAHRAGARVVLLNRDPGPYDAEADLVVRGQLGPVCEQLRGALR